mgnify:CR=1 FL=1
MRIVLIIKLIYLEKDSKYRSIRCTCWETYIYNNICGSAVNNCKVIIWRLECSTRSSNIPKRWSSESYFCELCSRVKAPECFENVSRRKNKRVSLYIHISRPCDLCSSISKTCDYLLCVWSFTISIIPYEFQHTKCSISGSTRRRPYIKSKIYKLLISKKSCIVSLLIDTLYLFKWRLFWVYLSVW